jgi:hypothetical protein
VIDTDLDFRVGPEHDLAPKSDGPFTRLLFTLFPWWQPVELGYAARIDWPATPGGQPTHAFAGSVRRTPKSAQRAADRLWSYWAKGPSRPTSVGVVFISRTTYRNHWKLDPCSSTTCNRET